MSIESILMVTGLALMIALISINWALWKIVGATEESNRLKKLELQYKNKETIPIGEIHHI